MGGSGAGDGLRLPPHSVEAEQSVLGGLMLDASAWDQVADRVIAEDFYRNDHRLIFEAVAGLIERNQTCDAVTLRSVAMRRSSVTTGSERASPLARRCCFSFCSTSRIAWKSFSRDHAMKW